MNFKISSLLLAKSLKFPTEGFNILHHISFSSSHTRSLSGHKLHLPHTNNSNRHSFFHRLLQLWNAILIIDLYIFLYPLAIKIKLNWNHFVSNFVSKDPCTLHLLCPCNKYYNSPPLMNLNTL